MFSTFGSRPPFRFGNWWAWLWWRFFGFVPGPTPDKHGYNAAKPNRAEDSSGPGLSSHGDVGTTGEENDGYGKGEYLT
jgi:hypothetical protein